MKAFLNKQISRPKQYSIGISLILLASIASYLSHNVIGYRAVALILLLAVSISAMLFDILPVLVCALLSALILNYFFIPPTLTLKIQSAEDLLMFLMYFIIAMINAVLTVKIRQFESKKRDEEEKEKTIELYNTLLNSLSHELRTPISTIIGAIDTIVDNEERLSRNNIRELYTEIEIAGDRLNRQVENLLNMSRLDAGTLKPTFDWFDINELIFKVINQTNTTDENRVVFQPDDNLSLVYIDGGFLETILHNLVHNALEHTPKSCTIGIDAGYVNERLIIDIADNGAGFPVGEIDLVFDKFYKLNGTGTGGTGLGLSIVKGFTEALNGKITLRNKKLGGAHFKIEIPAEFSSLELIENEQGRNIDNR